MAEATGRPPDGWAAAGVVLAGGRSSRMGRDKADVPWRGTTLLGHVLGVLAEAVDGPLVAVGAADRALVLPPLPASVAARTRTVADAAPGGGPLRGLATGLASAAARGADRAVVVSVDLPLLHPTYVRAVLARFAGDVEVVLPVLHGHRQPLAAAYATTLGARAGALLDAGARRPAELFAASRVLELTATDLLADVALAGVDPELDAVRGANTPDELDALTHLDRAPAWHHRRMASLSDPDVRAFLSQGTRTGKLGFTASDGRPLVAPVWFVVEGDEIVFNTGAATAKGRAVARDPRLVLCVDLEEPPFGFVQVQGVATVSEDPDELLRTATAIAGRYMGADRAEEFGRRNGVPGELIVRLRPTRVNASMDMTG